MIVRSEVRPEDRFRIDALLQRSRDTHRALSLWDIAERVEGKFSHEWPVTVFGSEKGLRGAVNRHFHVFVHYVRALTAFARSRAAIALLEGLPVATRHTRLAEVKHEQRRLEREKNARDRRDPARRRRSSVAATARPLPGRSEKPSNGPRPPRWRFTPPPPATSSDCCVGATRGRPSSTMRTMPWQHGASATLPGLRRCSCLDGGRAAANVYEA
jgi:hypothetical protein